MRCARQAATCLELGQGGRDELKERLQKKLKNEVRNRPKNHEILIPGAILEPSGDPLGGLGVSGGASGDFCSELVEIFGEVGAKMGPRWRQDGPSWQQVGPKMGHDSAKMTMLGSVWELLGGSWPLKAGVQNA